VLELAWPVILQQRSINRHSGLGALSNGDGHEQNITRRISGYIDAANAAFCQKQTCFLKKRDGTE
jgi:hypothetical protein